MRRIFDIKRRLQISQNLTIDSLEILIDGIIDVTVAMDVPFIVLLSFREAFNCVFIMDFG